MASFRNALFLFVVVVGGVNSATFHQRDYKHRSSVWSAKKTSPLNILSPWKNHEHGGNTAGVSGAKGCLLPTVVAATAYEKQTFEEGQKIEQVTAEKLAFYIDQPNRRTVEDYMVQDGVNISFITLCNGSSSATWYAVWKTKKRCRKFQMTYCPIGTDPVRYPYNGTLIASFHLGAGPGALGAQLWSSTAVARKVVTVTEVVLTPDDCVPVGLIQETRVGDQKFTIESVFTDVTLSIPDPSVFVPPPYCKQEEEEDDDDDETLAFGPHEFDITALFKRFAPLR